MFSLSDAYVKVRKFLKTLSNEERRNLYIVKCDVEHSYDTLDQNKVLELVDMLIQEKSYIVRDFAQIFKRNKEQLVYAKRQECMTSSHFSQIQKSVESCKDNSIFVDETTLSKESGDNVKEIIRKHVTENIIKCGKKIYKKSKGIAQGSTVSVLLCSLAYASLERHVLEKGSGDMSKTLLMHFVDDFLLVTTDLDVAMTFVQKTHKGLPEYGCWMNPTKTQLTFHMKEFTASKPTDKVSWCGKIVTKDLSFMTDYSRYYNKSKKKKKKDVCLNLFNNLFCVFCVYTFISFSFLLNSAKG